MIDHVKLLTWCLKPATRNLYITTIYATLNFEIFVFLNFSSA